MQSHMLICQESSQNNHVNASNRFNQSVNCKDCVSPIVPSTLKLSNRTEVRDGRNSDTIMLKPYNQMVLNRSIDHENNAIKKNTRSQLDTGSLSKLLMNLYFNSNNRQNLSTKTHSYTTMEDGTNNDRWSIKLSESRARKLRRDVKDSEKRQSKEEGEIRRQSKEGKKRQLTEEESGKQQKSRIKEETWEQNEKTGKTQRQSKRKNKTWRQGEKEKEKRRYSKEKGIKRRQKIEEGANTITIKLYLFFY